MCQAIWDIWSPYREFSFHLLYKEDVNWTERIRGIVNAKVLEKDNLSRGTESLLQGSFVYLRNRKSESDGGKSGIR